MKIIQCKLLDVFEDIFRRVLNVYSILLIITKIKNFENIEISISHKLKNTILTILLLKLGNN